MTRSDKPSDIDDLLNTIESTRDESVRLQAIKKVALQNNSAACRALLDVYRTILWRSTKIALILEIGRIDHPRSVEFLIELAENNHDFGLATCAVRALGQLRSSLAGEFLLRTVQEQDHPLRIDCVQALAHMPFFSWQTDLQSLLYSKEPSITHSLQQALILCAGRTHIFSSLHTIEQFLTDSNSNTAEGVFHAALVSAGMIGDEDTAEMLSRLRLDACFFSDQLRRSSVTQIYLRRKQNVEDIVTEILASSDERKSDELLGLLAGFTWHEIVETYGVLADELNPNLQLRFRMVLFDPTRLQSDLAFFQIHHRTMEIELVASLLRMHGAHQPLILEFLKAADPFFACEIGKRLRCATFMAIFGEILSKHDLPEKTRIEAVNAIVAQVIMSYREPSQAKIATTTLAKVIFSDDSMSVRMRCLRALGQIRLIDKSLLKRLSKLSEESLSVRASLYPTLAQLNHSQSTSILVKALRSLIETNAESDQFAPVLKSLARLEGPLGSQDLDNLPANVIDTYTLDILQIVAKGKMKGFCPFINRCLTSKNFQTQVWAIAAARYNADQATWKILTEFLSNSSVCLSGRAIDTLCLAGGPYEHEMLLVHLANHSSDRELAQKIFRSLTPRADQSYSGVLNQMNEFCQARPGVLGTDPEVFEQATNLRDNLYLRQINHEAGKNSTVRKDVVVSETHHGLDLELGQTIVHYHHFSENMKTVLRNAQLTMKHPELFDERVDKSTVIVEIVKAIDIFLQERIGTVMFLTDLDRMLAKMQSRVLLLRTNDDSISNQERIRMLQCSQQFLPDMFPNHKLLQLSNSIITGKFAREQYKAVDGLRAWALLLLLFGRKFDYLQQTIEPIFPVKTPANSIIADICIKLIDLQDLRNRAAHRGTVLAVDEAVQIRREALAMLESLASAL